MKVYYEFDPIDEEESDNPLISKFAHMAKENLLNISFKFKYRLMWELRHLESEINEDGGVIIIRNGKLETKDFSIETSEKIGEAFRSINWNYW